MIITAIIIDNIVVVIVIIEMVLLVKKSLVVLNLDAALKNFLILYLFPFSPLLLLLISQYIN